MPILIRLAFKTQLVDSPNGDPLKIHRTPIPLLGGLGIVMGLVVSLLFAAQVSDFLNSDVYVLIAALLLTFFVGLVDDYHGLSPLARLIAQCVVAVVLLQFSGYFQIEIQDHPVTFIIATFFLIIGTNASNLLDGMDGLASGITLIAAIGFLFGYVAIEDSSGMIISLSLIGASAAFLIFNFHPAKIFLGDNGSTVLGFALAILAIPYLPKEYSTRDLLFPLVIMVVPLFELCMTVVRRLKERVPVTHGDRNHFYDYLMRCGFSQKQTVIIMYCFGLLGTLVGVNFLQQ
ncbi:undecaprenyl/decaprenyl-phosphate alpha-N-acetylglucosaminyl 1-phosphate transferase [bacterium]|nr:undecaprenyl/decaprenyl-phosphate alpha-N-acetylglucosaminyl 1-phosphate transferase [bacterium]